MHERLEVVAEKQFERPTFREYLITGWLRNLCYYERYTEHRM